MMDTPEKEEALRTIFEREGKILPSVLVKESKAVRHPYHEAIWILSDKDLALKQRLAIARREISHFRFPATSTNVLSGPVYVALPKSYAVEGDGFESQERGYRDIRTLRGKEAKEQAREELDSLIPYVKRASKVVNQLGFSSTSRRLDRMARALEADEIN